MTADIFYWKKFSNIRAKEKLSYTCTYQEKIFSK